MLDEEFVEKRVVGAFRGGRRLPPDLPAEAITLMETLTRWVELVDRKTGARIAIFFCRTEEDAMQVDAALAALEPPDGSGNRTSVGIYQVAVDYSFERESE